MKILFVITDQTSQPGGHKFSLEHTAKAVSSFATVGILVLGKSVVLRNNPFLLGEISPSYSHIEGIRSVVDKYSPDVIHYFDNSSYLFFLIYLNKYCRKQILTKCGGPSPRFGLKFPFCKNVILYSKEDLEFFGRNILFRNVSFEYIPNRICRTLLNVRTVCNHRKENDCFIFLQVIRFHEGKKKQIFSSLNLIRLLKSQNLNVKLLLAGTINSSVIYEEVKRYIQNYQLDEFVDVITDERVNRGSDLLSEADCVIGTGRSVMEAAIWGKIILTPAANISVPVVLTKENFNIFFDKNFSGRAVINNTEKNIIQEIKNIILDKNISAEIVADISCLSQEFFEFSDKVKNRYRNLYLSLKESNCRYLFLRNMFSIMNFLFCVKK